MCSIKDLTILVVDPDKEELHKTCTSLTSLGINVIICAHTYQEAITIIENDSDIDLVIAEINLNTIDAIDTISSTGIFLCEWVKKNKPNLLFLISSRTKGLQVMCKSFAAGADGIVNKLYSNEIETVVPKWLEVAVKRRDVEVIINC